MPELQDIELLARYARENSEEAFAALAGRPSALFIPSSCGAPANRTRGENHKGRLLILARKAILTGRLHQTSQLTATNFLRTEIRRQNRGQEACIYAISFG